MGPQTLDKIDESGPGSAFGREESDFARLALVLWGYRIWIAMFTACFTLAGVLYAIMAKPVFQSQAIIALKEGGKPGPAGGLLAQFGGVGGMVAAQLGVGNTSLDKIEIILKGRALAESVIVRNDLLPALFPDSWNAKDSAWKSNDPKRRPTVRRGVEHLRENVLSVNTDLKKGVMKVGARARDSLLAKRIVDHYLRELNHKIRRDVMVAADAERGYLENQLSMVSDPVLREKVHALIASQFERSMLVSSQAFEILEEPVVPILKSGPKRKKIVFISFFMGALLSIGGVFAWRGWRAFRMLATTGIPDRKA